MTRIYLDWNASAPLRDSARRAIQDALDHCGNPSSVHTEGRHARHVIDNARQSLAEVLGIDPMTITFTSGATESAAIGLGGRHLRSSWIEHDCILSWTEQELVTDTDGQVAIEDPARSCLQLANGETGVIQHLPAGLALTDATQAFGKIPVHDAVSRVGLTLVSAHKIGGPKGVGAVIGSLDPDTTFSISGGGQEYGRRSGTENVYGIAGFGAAAVEADEEVRRGDWERVGELRDRLEVMLMDMSPDIVFFGNAASRLPNTSCFAAPGWKGETQVIEMDLAGIAISSGAACSSGKVGASKVLKAMGVHDELARSAIRVSIGPATDLHNIETFVRKWGRGLARQKHRVKGIVPPVHSIRTQI